MLFSREKEEDDDFIPNPNYQSNLASIFNSGTSSGNPSLTYTAPKQPKRLTKAVATPSPAATQTANTSSHTVVIVKAVQAFKMVGGSYLNQGRLAAAVVNFLSDNASVYQLVLYRDKRNPLCVGKVTRDFDFHIQPKNYCTFYDKQGTIWSILFETALELSEFALQVGVARWKAGDPTSPLIVQDLWCPVREPGSGTRVAAAGDSVEMTYSLHSISGGPQGAEETESVWVEVEESGWKSALVGLQPTSKRVVILQPSMLGDLNPQEVEYHGPMVVRMTVVQVTKAGQCPAALHTGANLPPVDTGRAAEPSEGTQQHMEQAPQQPSVAVSADSLRPSKADLISRMARMGQALPFKTAAPTPSDSDEPEEDRRGRRSTAPRPRTRHHLPAPAPQAPAEPAPAAPPLASPLALAHHPLALAATPYMAAGSMGVGLFPPAAVSVDSQAQFNMFFSEVRTTNSELRMGLTRLTDKVDALHSKLGESERRGSGATVTAAVGGGGGRELTANMERLLQSEQLIREQLQQVLAAVQASQQASAHVSIATPPSPVNQDPTVSPADGPPQAPTDAPSSSQGPCLHCSELEASNNSLMEQLKKLQDENEYLQTSLEAQKDALQNARLADQDQLARIESLQKQIEEDQEKLVKSDEKLQNVLVEKESLQQDFQGARDTISELQTTLQEKQQSIDQLEQSLRESEATKLEEVRRNLQEVLDPRPLIAEQVKRIMNTVYRLFKVQFQPQANYEVVYILSVLAETIKAVTAEYLQNGDLQGYQDQTTDQEVEEPQLEVQYVRREQRSPQREVEKRVIEGSTTAVAGEVKPASGGEMVVAAGAVGDQEVSAGGEADSCPGSAVVAGSWGVQNVTVTSNDISSCHTLTAENLCSDKLPAIGEVNKSAIEEDKGEPKKSSPAVAAVEPLDDLYRLASLCHWEAGGRTLPVSDKLQAVLFHLSRSQSRLLSPSPTATPSASHNCCQHPHPHSHPQFAQVAHFLNNF